MSFYVVSVKDRIQALGIMYPPYCYQAFSDEIETLRATDPKADLGLSTKIMTLCSHYMLEKDLRYATAEATKDIVISV
jgi:hypothetical protein